MKRSITLLATSLLMAGATAFAAEGTVKPDRPHKGPRQLQSGEMLLPPRALEALALTAEQQAKYDDLLAQWKKEAEKFWTDHAPLRDRMREAQRDRDRAKPGDLLKEMKPLQEARQSSLEKMRGFLTDEQKKKLDDMREEMESRRGEHGSHGRERGGPPPSPVPAP